MPPCFTALSYESVAYANFIRWQKRHPAIPLDVPAPIRRSPGDTVQSSSASPSDNAERDELAAAVREQIHTLPHNLKTAVLLFEYEDLSIRKSRACSAAARKILRQKLVAWSSE